jgi:hypothetical protein
MNVGSLSRQLIRLVTSASLRRQIGLRAAGQARARWLWPQTVEQMRQVYEEVTPSSPASSMTLQAS